jgi:hypothetical protein
LFKENAENKIPTEIVIKMPNKIFLCVLFIILGICFPLYPGLLYIYDVNFLIYIYAQFLSGRISFVFFVDDSFVDMEFFLEGSCSLACFKTRSIVVVCYISCSEYSWNS